MPFRKNILHNIVPFCLIAHTLLLEAGVNIVYIRDILGHVNIATTGIYARSNLEMKKKALEKVAIVPDTSDVPFWTEDKDLLSWLEGYGKSL